MNINKRRVLQSEDEDNSTNKNSCLKKITKRRRIIELECTSDEDDVSYSQNFDSAKEIKGQYAQRISKIKRNSGQEYCTKNVKITPEKKFENKNCNCSKKMCRTY